MLKYLMEQYKIKRGDLNTPRMLKLFMYDLVVTNRLYDDLKYPFHTADAQTLKYLPLRERRPSATLNVCAVVVDACASLLFGENHFPQIHIEDEVTRKTIKKLDKCVNFKKVFQDAVKYGSIGSVAILVGVIDGQLFVLPKKTIFMEPEFDNEKTRNLVKVTEKYQTTGRCLKTIGYDIDDDDLEKMYWVQHEWTKTKEIRYKPWKVAASTTKEETESKLVEDGERSFEHNLGFVPIVWIQNLPGGDLVDGMCTFERAIDTMIERDYLMSQGGRGLRYSSDPLLLIKSDSYLPEEPFVKSSDNMLNIPKDGDAKLLEITGGAVEALEKFAKVLREQALEAIHGNRSDANKLSVAQSGRAMEMMNQDLIWLCETLRNCYGELGLVKVVEMILRIAQTTTIMVKDKPIDAVKCDEDVVLIWSSWYAPTPDDLQKTAIAITAFRSAQVVSKETAIRSIAPMFDIEDIAEELDQIEDDVSLEDEASNSSTALEEPKHDSKQKPEENLNDRANN